MERKEKGDTYSLQQREDDRLLCDVGDCVGWAVDDVFNALGEGPRQGLHQCHNVLRIQFCQTGGFP